MSKLLMKDDPRPIAGIYEKGGVWENTDGLLHYAGAAKWEVGKGKVTRIRPYIESGPRFAVYMGDEIVARVNDSAIKYVYYKPGVKPKVAKASAEA